MPAPKNQIPLFLDCDPGVDDAVALGYLLCQDDVDVVGIAASGGNVSTAQVVRNTLGWLELAGRADLSVHPGAAQPLAQRPDPEHSDGDEAGDQLREDAGHGDPEYAEETHGDTGTGYAVLPDPATEPGAATAAEAWVDAARAHPGELIGVLTGPATNLALALDLEPGLPRLVKRLFVMGGAFNYRGNTHPTTEWNITYDPEAAARVFTAFGRGDDSGAARRLPVIGPIEATEAVEMTPERLEAIRSSAAGPVWKAWLDQLGEALRFYFEFHEADGHGYLAHVHDPYVLAAAIGWARRADGSAAASRAVDPGASADPNTAADSRDAAEPGMIPWAETAVAPVDVELTGTLTRGETVADWLGRWGRPANAEIIRRIDAASFLDHLTETLQRGPNHDLPR